MTLAPGPNAEVELTVTDADTATAVGSGDVPALATPRLVALAEAATVAALAAVPAGRGGLDDGQTTVGTLVRLEHLAASPVGATVRVRAELVEVDGGRLRFEVAATDAGRIVGRGEVVRAVVNRRRFLERLGGPGAGAGG